MNESRYTENLNIRLNKQQVNILKQKALEQNVSMSTLIRQALINYINRTLSDTELLYASMNEISKKVRYLDNKVELLALIIMEQTKYHMTVLPHNPVNISAMAEMDYEKFEKSCFKSLKTNHRGKLESMLLDLYEQQDDEQDEQ